MTAKQCRLCSRLSSFLSWLNRYIPLGRFLCLALHQLTYSDNQRVQALSNAAPDCQCERHRMSWYSPQAVENDEELARFLFSPIHIDKRKKVLPAAFSHIENKGCSVQREGLASVQAASELASSMMRNSSKAVWAGVLLGKCCEVREITVGDNGARYVCIYDTAEKSAPAHAEICRTQRTFEEGDANEMRAKLRRAFGNGAYLPPDQYRGGACLNGLPAEQIRRITAT